MGAAGSVFEDGGACDLTSPPPELNLDGPPHELVTRSGELNLLVVHVSGGASERVRNHHFGGKPCALEIEIKVLRGMVTAMAISVNTRPRGKRKLVPLPVQPEVEAPPAHAQGAWGAGSSGYPARAPPTELGSGGVARFRLTALHTNNFENGDYYVSCSAITPGSMLVKATTLVDQGNGAGLAPLQLIAHQQRLIPDLLPDVSLNWGGRNGTVQQQQQAQAQAQSPFAQAGVGSTHQFTHPSSHAGNPAECLVHIRNLEREIADQNAEISSLKRQNRALDEKLYHASRNGGVSGGGGPGVNEMQLARYKEYILKAKEVIQQQKERIVDLETTTLVGRLEAHLLEYREYASRQKLKITEMSQDMEGMERETRELRQEADELRERYHVLKRGNSQYRDEPSPRRTPHYSQRRPVAYYRDGPASPGHRHHDLGPLPGSNYHDGPASPYADDRYDRMRGGMPKTPNAGSTFGERELARARERSRERWEREQRDRDYRGSGSGESREEREARQREEVRAQHEREWVKEYERSHGYPPAPENNPYALGSKVRSSSSGYGGSSSQYGSRHRNATSRKRYSDAHYYDRYGRHSSTRDKAAITIQSAYRGWSYRRAQARKGGSSKGYGSSGSYKYDSRHKSPTHHAPTSSASTKRRAALEPVRSSSSRHGSSSTHHRSGSSRYSSREEEEERAARKIQSAYKAALLRRKDRLASSSSGSSNRHRPSSSAHKPSSSSSSSSSRGSLKPLTLAQQAAARSGVSSTRGAERDRERERDREAERDRGSSSRHASSSRHR